MPIQEVNPIKDRQVSLFSINDYENLLIEEWGWFDEPNSELGTNKSLVPNSPVSKLGVCKSLVPNSPNCELGVCKSLVPNSGGNGNGGGKNSVPNFDDWKPPVGCLQQKWIKDRQYWYWRYYDNRRKKRSLYLGRDYNKAILKAQKIGIPPDANSNHRHPPQTDSQT